MHDEQKNINAWADKLNDLPLPDMQEAWTGMEAVLNNEMPVHQKKDWRRWVILIILLLLLIGVCNCPGYLRLGRHTAKKDTTGKAQANTTGTQSSSAETGNNDDGQTGNSSFLPTDMEANKMSNEQPTDHTNAATHKTPQQTLPAEAIADNKSKRSGNENKRPGSEEIPSSRDITNSSSALVISGSTKDKNPVQKNIGQPLKTKNKQRSSNKGENSFGDALLTRSKNGSKNKKPTLKDKQNNPPVKNKTHISNSENTKTDAGVQTKDDSSILQKTGNTDSSSQPLAKDSINKKDSASIANKRVPVDSTVTTKKKTTDSTSEKGWAIAVGLNHIFPIGDQQSSNFNSGGTTGSWKDYIPVPQVRYHFNKKLYAQIEAQFNAPQYTKSLLAKQTTSLDSTPGGVRQQNSVTIKKLFYLNIPLSVHYSPFKNFYVGTGLQYSRLSNAVGLLEDKSVRAGSPDSLKSSKTQSIKSDSSYSLLTTSEWRLLFDANYHWRRFIIGARYNYALSRFINVQVSATQLTQARNSSLQFYLRYTLWDQRRKKSNTSK